jgi:hypothetical protein
MCWKITCLDCGKISWDGCGLHIAAALQDVNMMDRCDYWKQGRHPDGKEAETKSSSEDSKCNNSVEAKSALTSSFDVSILL